MSRARYLSTPLALALLAVGLLPFSSALCQSVSPVGRRAEAEIARLQAALARNPTDTRARESLGLVYEGQGRIQEAIEQYRILCAAAPDDSEFMYRLGRAYLSAAQIYSQRLRSKAPRSARIPQLIAEKRAGDGSTDLAMDAYREALRLDPRLPGVHLALARLLAAAGDAKAARLEVERELALDPDSVEARTFRDGLATNPAGP